MKGLSLSLHSDLDFEYEIKLHPLICVTHFIPNTIWLPFDFATHERQLSTMERGSAVFGQFHSGRLTVNCSDPDPNAIGFLCRLLESEERKEVRNITLFNS
jgi:hypothetical protein